MDKKFDMDYIKQLTKEMSKNSSIAYDDLPKYDLFLSQVIDYLNDKFPNEKFTNNIHGYKIAHISDIHYGTSITKKESANCKLRITLRRFSSIIFISSL